MRGGGLEKRRLNRICPMLIDTYQWQNKESRTFLSGIKWKDKRQQAQIKHKISHLHIMIFFSCGGGQPMAQDAQDASPSLQIFKSPLGTVLGNVC